MRPRLLAASRAILGAAFVIVPRAEQATPRGAQPASSCDRRCLLQFLTDYFPKNNPSVVREVFKVQDWVIRHIFAFFRGNGQPDSGWPDVQAN